MPLKAVLDANVLFPFTLRDTLLRAFSELLAGLEKSVPGFVKDVRGVSKQP